MKHSLKLMFVGFLLIILPTSVMFVIPYSSSYADIVSAIWLALGVLGLGIILGGALCGGMDEIDRTVVKGKHTSSCIKAPPSDRFLQQHNLESGVTKK